jgi:peptidylprolyl isomerase
MTQVKHGDTVHLQYTLYTGADRTTAHRVPVEFTIGAAHIIPGLEEVVIGMQPGDTKSIHLPAEKAFGPHWYELVITADPDRFFGGTRQVGQTVPLVVAGDIVSGKISALSESQVTVDLNHPLAGKVLDCDVQLIHIVSGIADA